MILTEWGKLSSETMRFDDRSKVWNAVLDTIMEKPDFKNGLIELVGDKAPAVMTLFALQRQKIQKTKEEKIIALLKNRYNVAETILLSDIEKVLK